MRCGRKPTRKRVHALRVVTLRILAELEYRIGEQGIGGTKTEGAAHWIKLGAKLRQALSPVREADVWLDKLAALRESLSDTNGYNLRSNRACIRQLDELKEKLKEKRRLWEKKFVAEIESRRQRLEESAQLIELAPHPLTEDHGEPQSVAGASQIGEQLARVVEEFPSLDAGNLHEFRKRIKKVRYLAEIFAQHDPEAGRQASSIRKVQSVIGDWHDWQALAEREGHARGKREELTELLETLAAESLEKALAACERLKTNLLKKGHETQNPSGFSAKKPPARGVEPVGALGLDRSA